VEPHRFLFVTLDGGGNWPPTAGLARALVRRGHETLLLSNPVQQQRIESAGFAFAAYRTAPAWEANFAPPPGQVRAADNFLMHPAVAEDVLAEVGRYRPDALVVDCMLYAAVVAAELSQLPAAILVHTLLEAFTLERNLDRVRRSLELRRALGLRDVTSNIELWSRAAICLIATLPVLDRASATAPASFRYVSPMFDEPARPGSWVAPWPVDDAKPLVLVAFTTMFAEQLLVVLQTVVDALASAPVRVLVTTGPMVDPLAIKSPANATIVQFIPHSWVLPAASLVITHAGHSTAIAAVAHGVPMLCMPFGKDQPLVAGRIAEAGAARVLAWDARPAEIAAAVQEMLADPAYRAAAQRLAAMIQEQGGGEQAVRLLESLLPKA